jgi:NADPH2:quinone reductase
MKAIRIHSQGGVDQLKLENIEKPKITGPKEILVKNASSGINYIDTYHRSGNFFLVQM